MKQILNKSILAIVLIATTFACTNNPKEEKATSPKKDITYLSDKTTLKWTAYKTTDKLGVNGTFNNIIVENNKKANSVEDIIVSTEFKIPTSSVFTGNVPRDIILKEYFFGAMLSTDTIYGSFSSAKDGKGLVTIKMNDVEFKNDFTYSFKGDSLKINTSILLDNWNGYTALSSLHKQCFDMHTGPDGVSKTWPDVDLEIVSIFSGK